MCGHYYFVGRSLWIVVLYVVTNVLEERIVSICGVLNDAVSSSDCIVSNDMMANE
jgi:hypothetical protein